MNLAAVANRKPPRRGVSAAKPILDLAAGIAIIGATISPNPILSLVSLATLALVWVGALKCPIRTILAAYLSFQWLQATSKIWIANCIGVDLSVAQSTVFGEKGLILNVADTAQEAILLGLACIASLSVGFRMSAPRVGAFRPDVADLGAAKLASLYFILLPVSMVAGPFVGGGLAQFLIVVGALRFAPAVVLFFRWLAFRREIMPVLCIVATEMVIGFTRYFSSFRVVFFIFGASAMTLVRTYERRTAMFFAGAFAVLMVLGSFWTLIKPAYRASLSQGATSQAVTLAFEDRLKLLAEMAGNVNASDLPDGLAEMALRISYTDYLEEVLRYVPAFVPHQNGRLWGEAVANVLAPRLLFPDKAVLISDSERTMAFTGQELASDQEGTSISLGYVAESYIDFGIAGALIVSALIGVFYALIVRSMLKLNRDRDLTIIVSVLVVLFFEVQEFEASNVKLLGGMMWNWIVCALFVRFAWPELRRFCSNRQAVLIGPWSGRAR